MKYFKSRSHFQYDSDTHHTNISPQIKTIMVYLSFKKVVWNNPLYLIEKYPRADNAVLNLFSMLLKYHQ